MGRSKEGKEDSQERCVGDRIHRGGRGLHHFGSCVVVVADCAIILGYELFHPSDLAASRKRDRQRNKEEKIKTKNMKKNILD
jgi:hypothetical protein